MLPDLSSGTNANKGTTMETEFGFDDAQKMWKALRKLSEKELEIVTNTIDQLATGCSSAINANTGKVDEEMTHKVKNALGVFRNAIMPVLRSLGQPQETSGMIDTLLDNIKKEKERRRQNVQHGKIEGFSIDISKLDKFSNN